MTSTWVWVGLTWSDRVKLVLDRYGDRLTDVSIFGWRIGVDGNLTQFFDPTKLDPYRAKWPHIRWWLCTMNDGVSTTYDAVRDVPAIQDTYVAACGALLDAHPWANGLDVDLERGGEINHASAAEALFTRLAATCHTRGKKLNACLPGMDAENASVGGENWCRYSALGTILDHLCIMSYGMAWQGSAPGPVSPRDWLEGIYHYITTVVDPGKVSMGLPAYGIDWRIHDYPPYPTITTGYRGSTITYYGARLWQDGTYVHDPAPQPHIPWLAIRDPYEHAPYALPHVYDWCQAVDHNASLGVIDSTYNRHSFTTRYGVSSGTPLWTVADQTAPTAYASYTLAPRMFRDKDGNWVGPQAGFTLTLESLKRPPESALIWDEDCRTPGILATSYYAKQGSWTQWVTPNSPDLRPYSQARTTGGTLSLNHDFGGKALHVQARLQLPTAGFAGVRIGGVRAEISNTGTLRLTSNGSTVASTTVAAPGLATTPNVGSVVIGLRVRGTHARLYYGTSEANITLRLEGSTSSPDGTVGLWASGTAWFDHLRVGDGWWYEPREAFRVQLGADVWTMGRVPRTGVTWNTALNVFRPDTDVEEDATRTRDISPDWDFDHQPVTIACGETRQVIIRPLDVGCWLGRIFLVDAQGASIFWYSDVEYLAYWMDRAHHEYHLDGICLWALGQEDIRLWERLKGGELPQSAAA